MVRFRPLIERLLLQERDRQIAQSGKQGMRVVRWGYTVRKHWHTPWGVLKRVRMPRLRRDREIGLMGKYYPQFAARIDRADRGHKKSLEHWATWTFFLKTGSFILTAQTMRS